ncbi:MAG: hypothetical protein K0Q77_74 [Anaerosporomusa subterranea]|nr:hypothetical protein [Anaerosporomusa subterranea]
MSERKLVVDTAQGWFDSARNDNYSMAEKLICMENALNHTENALVAERSKTTHLQSVVAIGADNVREAWGALRLVRMILEECAPPSSVPNDEYIDPNFTSHGMALVEGIVALRDQAARVLQERDSARATIAAMRSALKDAHNYIYDNAPTGTVTNQFVRDIAKIMQTIDQALSNTAGADILQRVRDLEQTLEQERTEVAKGVNAIKQAIKLRNWMLEGRGPYAYNDDRWIGEFADAIKEIESALDPLERIARDTSNRTTAGAEYAERVKRLEEAAQAVLDRTGDSGETPSVSVCAVKLRGLQAVLGEGK